MRILVVCQYYYPEPFRIVDICEELVKRGHKVTVLTGLPNYPEGNILMEYRYGKNRNEFRNGVRIVRTFEIGRGNNNIRLFLNYFSFAFSSRLKVKKLEDGFDVVFVNQLSPVMMACAAVKYKKLRKIPLFLYCLDLWPDSMIAGGIKKGSIVYNAFKKVSRNIYCKADRIAITSNSFNDYFINEMGLSKERIAYLPQYTEEIFSLIKTHKTNKLGFDLVFAGNIGKLQSVETILKAAFELRERKDIRFHIVGDGSNLSFCKKIAGESENVVFYGRKPVEEIPELYRMADAMLITLSDDQVISKTLPGKVQSYMAAGKPILGAINGETASIIKEAACGYCCPAEDHKGLAEAIIRFTETDDYDQMGINARKYYEQNYSKDKFFGRLEVMLNDLILFST